LTIVDLKEIPWDYGDPSEDEVWRAGRLAEFFPFLTDNLTQEDKELIIRCLDQINLPEERKEIIRISQR
jgi:hypothetical protein